MLKLHLSMIAFVMTSVVFAQDDVNKIKELLAKDTGRYKFGNHPAAGKFYNVRSFKMYAEVYGSGTPVLFIHGNGGSISDFTFQIPYYSKKYQVIVADSRAQGKSVDSGDSLSYEMMADDFSELLVQMKIDSAYIVGWSDGGINALLLAIRHPEKVRKLAITGANLWPDSTAVYSDVINLILPDYNSLRLNRNKTSKEKSSWKLLRLLIEEPHIALTELNRISVPALVISGDHDVIKPEHTMLIARNIPKSYLWIIPNSGHSTPMVYREEFNRKVDEFFSCSYRIIGGVNRFY